MKFRVNNIGVEEPQHAGPAPSRRERRDTLCIVKHHPNRYHGMMEEYLSSGWSDRGDFLECRGITLSKSIFSGEESSYVLAFVHLEKDCECTRLESVEDRPLGLSPSEHSDFFEAYQQASLALLRRAP